MAKNRTPKDRKTKEQALSQKANKWTDSSSANCSEDNPSRKELGERQENIVKKVTLRREKGDLQKRKQSY